MNRHYITSATQSVVKRLSRRNAISWLGVGGLTTAFVVGSNTIASAENARTRKLVQAWVDAQNAHDPAHLAALYTNDGTFEDVPNQIVIQGQNNILCFRQGVEQIFGNIKIELQNTFASKDYASAEYLFSAINNGFIPVPSTIGKSFKVRTTTVFVIKENKIQRSSDYYDNAAILVQFGLIEPPPAAAVSSDKCE